MRRPRRSRGALASSFLGAVVAALGAACGDAPTWNGRVADVVGAHCARCHVDGGIGPFALTSYADASRFAVQMAAAVEARTMPPWPAGGDCQEYLDDARLSDDDIDAIMRWANAGAPEGEGAAKAAVAEAPRTLPRVDMELRADAPYLPRPTLGGTDDYHCVAVDPGLTEGADVTGFDVVPDRADELHHVLVFHTTEARARAADDAEEGEGWTCFGGPGTGDFALLAGWAPGGGAVRYPEGTGIHLDAGERIVLQFHYSAAASAAEPDQSAVLLTLADAPVQKRGAFELLLDDRLLIPPHSEGFRFRYERTAPTSVTLWSVVPHMHTRGRGIRLDRIHDGARTCLVDVPAWDFHWQLSYALAAPAGFAVAAGDTLEVTCTYDNPGSAAVAFGEATADEMCVVAFFATEDG